MKKHLVKHAGLYLTAFWLLAAIAFAIAGLSSKPGIPAVASVPAVETIPKETTQEIVEDIAKNVKLINSYLNVQKDLLDKEEAQRKLQRDNPPKHIWSLISPLPGVSDNGKLEIAIDFKSRIQISGLKTEPYPMNNHDTVIFPIEDIQKLQVEVRTVQGKRFWAKWEEVRMPKKP